MDSKPNFSKNNFVRLKRDLATSGVVVGDPIFSDGCWQYEVFFSAQDRRFIIELDLEIVPEHEVDLEGQIRFGDVDDLLRSLMLIKLRQPLADHLYGLYASRTKFEVYQFKPAIKFLGNPDQRLLIADEVGLGKTIEAGIIFLELQARLDLMRVLVICPPALKYKWQDEMRSRFDENFTILDREKLDKFIKDYQQYGENTRLRGIVALHLIRRTEFAEKFAALRVNFDLIIVDEAHHLRNPATASNNVVTILSENTDAMLFLTATPLHLGNQDLFHLLQILAPGDYDNKDAFIQQIEPNRHINLASQYLSSLNKSAALKELRMVEMYPISRRFLGNPFYKDVIEFLKRPGGVTEQFIRAQRNLLELNTISHIFTRTRKREVVTNAPVRAANTLMVNFSDAEWDFYEAVIDYVREQYRVQKGDWATGWVTIMRERQAASCISAVRSHFEQSLKDQYMVTQEDVNAVDELVNDEDQQNRLSLSDELETILQQLYGATKTNSLQKLVDIGKRIGSQDTKFMVFREAIQNVLAEDPNSKILVFSFFRGTLDHIYKELNRLGYKPLLMHGGVHLIDRKRIVEQFRDNSKVNILLSSEVGSEGLDFQFCNTLFNYDLPWNPMRVEQRIGRLDRFGQLHPRINIYNLVIENSIEERIFLRLYERIGIFRESIGDLEAILGDEIRELSSLIFSNKLTPRQEEEQAEQAARNIIRRKQELEEFEKFRMQFMGQEAIFSEEVRAAVESGKFISEPEIKALVETFVRNKFNRTRLEPDEEDPTCALFPGDDFKEYMRDFVLRTRATDQSAQDFLRRMNTNKVIPLTYSSEIAYQRKLVEFITLRHPITLAAISHWKEQPKEGLPVYEVTIETSQPPSGIFYFYIVAFKSEGMQRNSQLVPILISKDDLQVEPNLQDTFMRLLQSHLPFKVPSKDGFDENGFQQARSIALQEAATQRNRREQELQRSNDALVNARLAALEQTYTIKSKKVEEYIHAASESRIIRMREAQLRNIEAKHRNSVREIEERRKVSVSFSLELAGIANIVLKPGIAKDVAKESPAEVIAVEMPEVEPSTEEEPVAIEISLEEQSPLSDEVMDKPSIPEAPEVAAPTQPVPVKRKIETPLKSEPKPHVLVFSITNKQIELLLRKKGSLLSRLTGGGKVVLKSISERTGVNIQIDAKKGRIKFIGTSERALDEAVRMVKKELYG